MIIESYDVKKILEDNKNSTDVLLYNEFFWMKLSTFGLRRVNTPLIGFFSNSIKVQGEIVLVITTGQEPQQATVQLTSLIIWIPSTCNIILG